MPTIKLAIASKWQMQLKLLMTPLCCVLVDCTHHVWRCVINQRITLSTRATMSVRCSRLLNERLNTNWLQTTL